MRRWIWPLVSLLLLAACAPPRFTTPMPPMPTAMPTPMPTETPSPTSTRLPTPTPTPGPPTLSLTAPRWLGRGQIVDADFTPDGTAVAIGWATGVSLWDVAEARERWWQPTDVPVIAVDMHPTGEAVAAALVAASGDPLTDAAGPLILWERREDGAFEARFRTWTVRADYEEEPLALFNPAGNRVALEDLPRAEAGQLKTLVYDRDAGEVIRTLPEYALAAWVSDEVLLTAEAQRWTRLTQWNVRTGKKTVG